MSSKETPTDDTKKPVVSHNERCFNQFRNYCTEKNIKKINEDAIASFIKDCHEGWPNGTPKKETSLNIKYRGIVNHLKTNGKKVDLKRGFVKTVLES